MKRINVGIIGTGNMSQTMIGAMRASNKYDIKVLHSRSEEKGKKYSTKWQINSYINQIDDFVNYGLDFIYVASITKVHYEQVKLILNMGYNVICEKQFVLHYSQANELIELAKSKKLFLFIAHKTIYMPTGKKLITDIKSLKDIHAINITMFHERKYDFKLQDNKKISIEFLYDMYYYPLNIILNVFSDIDIDSIFSSFIRKDFTTNSQCTIFFKTSTNIPITMLIDYDMKTTSYSKIFARDYDIGISRWSNLNEYYVLNKKTGKKEIKSLYLDKDYDYYLYEINSFYKIYFENDLNWSYRQNKIDKLSVLITEKIEAQNK